jgi:P27 family predicted phage terminase small subunit
MRGKKPATNAELKAKGTFNSTIHGGRLNLPAIDGDQSPPPDFSAREIELWNHYVAEIRDMTVLSKQHLNSIALLCRLHSDREKLDAEIQKRGHVYETDSGLVKINPAVNARAKIDDQMMRLYEQFGFTARSSMSMKADKPRTASPLLAQLSGSKTKAG